MTLWGHARDWRWREAGACEMQLSLGRKQRKEGAGVVRETPRVVLYIDNARAFGGSMSSLMYTLAGLDRQRFEPVLVTGQQGKNQCEDVRSYRLPYSPYYRFMASIRSKVKEGQLPFAIRKAINGLCFATFVVTREFAYFVRLWRIARSVKPALIHLNNNLNSQMAGILLARTLGVPCVSHQRDYEARSRITRCLSGFVDQHIAVSESIKHNLITSGITPAKISVVTDALDVDMWKPERENGRLRKTFGIADGERVVGMFGRVVPWKGQHVFVRAMHRVCRMFPDVRGVIVGDHADGDPSYMNEVVRQVQLLDLESRIIMTGYRDDIRDLMAMMDIVVHASTRPEPFGMVIIEAMASGKPVIATQGGGPSEIIEDMKSGLLIPRGDSDSLGGAIVGLLGNRTYAEELGKEGRRVVEERFTHTRQAEVIGEIYTSLLDDRGRRGWQLRRVR